MKLKKKIFNILFEENQLGNKKLINLNEKITNLENEFEKKYGNKTFADYCTISELMIEELIESVNFSFKLGFKCRKLIKNKLR